MFRLRWNWNYTCFSQTQLKINDLQQKEYTVFAYHHSIFHKHFHVLNSTQKNKSICSTAAAAAPDCAFLFAQLHWAWSRAPGAARTLWLYSYSYHSVISRHVPTADQRQRRRFVDNCQRQFVWQITSTSTKILTICWHISIVLPVVVVVITADYYSGWVTTTTTTMMLMLMLVMMMISMWWLFNGLVFIQNYCK